MKCIAPGCDRTDGTYKDLCVRHYAQVRRTGGLLDGYGSRGQVCECGDAAIAKGMCGKHYQQHRNATHPKVLAERATRRFRGTADRQCGVEGCEGSHLARGLCESHYRSQPDRLERGRDVAARRRVRKRALAVEWPMPPAKVQARIDFYGGRCYICGVEDATTIDHVKPIAKGGPHIPANLRPCCLSCNSRKRDIWEGVV